MPHLNPKTLAAPLQNLYAQISIAPAGRIAFIAGQVALDAEGQLIGPGDHEAQALQCFRNIAAAIAAVGARPDQMVRMTINVVDHCDELVPVIFGAGREVFGDDWPVCASIFLGVVRLGLSDWLIEIDGIIALAD